MKLKSLPSHPICCFAITEKKKNRGKLHFRHFIEKVTVLHSVHGLI